MHRVTVLFISLLLLGGALNVQANSYSSAERQQIFHSVIKSIERWYPYFKDKGIAWKERKQEYARQLSSVRSDEELHHLIADMLHDLHDGHTALLDYPRQVKATPQGMPAMRLVEANGRVLVASVEPGHQAADAGITPGMEIIQVNGQAIEMLIQHRSETITASTSRYARYLSVQYLLQGPLNEPVSIEFADGRISKLKRKSYTPVIYDDAITYRRIGNKIGYLRIPHFREGDRLMQELTSALDSLRDTQALIIDIRGNPGGYTRVAARMAGRFFRARTLFTTFTRKQYVLGIGLTVPSMTFPVNPNGRWIYLRPIVLLIDPLVFSSAEFFAAGMKDSGRAMLIGQTTAGSSGNPKVFHAGPLTYRVSTWREYRRNGRLIEGQGIEPSITVVPTVDDLRAGIDSTLEAAIQHLENSTQLGAQAGSR